MMSALPLHGPVVQERRAAELSSCPLRGMRSRLSRNSTIAMKKTLMTLAALAAVSASASADGTLKWDLTFTDTAYSFTGSELARVSTGYNFTLVNGVFTTSGSGSRLLLGEYEDKALAMNTSFSLVIQGGLAVEPADGGVLFAFGDANGKYFTISAGADGQLVMSPEGYESAAPPPAPAGRLRRAWAPTS